MHFISIIGVTYFFLPIYITYSSNRALIVCINGILYHSTNNIVLRYNDILCNICMCYYTYYYDKEAIKTIIFVMFHFMVNSYLLKQKYISFNTSEIYHVICIQLPLSLCLKTQFKIN